MQQAQISKPQLREVLKRLNPRVPAGANDAVLPRVPRDPGVIEDLFAQLEADENAKALLAGHIGVGKSTELLHLAKKMSGQRFVLHCPVSQALGMVHTLDVFSLLMIILQTAIKAWLERLGEFPSGLRERLAAHIGDYLLKQGDEYDLNSKTTDTEISDLYAGSLKNISLLPISVRQKLAVDSNDTAKTCSTVLKQLADAAKMPVLLIIDDLDKVRDEPSQMDMFLDRVRTWASLPCGIVATIPLEAMYSPRGRELDDFWGEASMLNFLPVPVSDGDADEPTDFYYKVLQSADAAHLFDKRQYLKLALISGGSPRSFVNSCVDCVKNAIETNSSTIKDSHIRTYALQNMYKWQEWLNEKDYEALIIVMDSEGSNLGKPEALRLFGDGILLENYDASSDEQPVRLAEWAVPLLETYRKRSSFSKKPKP